MEKDNQKETKTVISEYFKSLSNLIHNIDSKLDTKRTGVTLSEIDKAKAKKIFNRLIYELLSLMDIRFYLEEELLKQPVDIDKCYYHIDHFYHQIYVLEEMLYGFISNLFLHRSFTDKEELKKELKKTGYIEIKNKISEYDRDTQIKEARKRRTELTHRTGKSARELQELWSGWDGTKRRANEKSREGEMRFCRREYNIIIDIIVKYFRFTLKFLVIIAKYLIVPKD